MLEELSNKVNTAIDGAIERLDRLKAGFGDIGPFGLPSIYTVSAFLSAIEGAKDAEELTDLQEKLTQLKEKLEEFKFLIKVEMEPISPGEVEKAKAVKGQFLKDKGLFKELNGEMNALLKEYPWARFSALKEEEQKNNYLVEFSRRLNEAEIISKLGNELKNREMLYKGEDILYLRIKTCGRGF